MINTNWKNNKSKIKINIILQLGYDQIEIYLKTVDGGKIIWGDGSETTFGPNTDTDFYHQYNDVAVYNIIIQCNSITQIEIYDLDLLNKPERNVKRMLKQQYKQEIKNKTITREKKKQYKQSKKQNRDPLNEHYSLDIVINSNPQLEYIEFDYCYVKSIEFNAVLPVLTEVDISDNYLTSIDLTKLPALDYIDLDDNDLTSFTVSNNPLLTYIDVNDNNITSVSLTNLPAIIEIRLDDNNLTSFTFTSTTLEDIDLSSNNNLSFVNLSGCSSLLELDCNYCNISTGINITGCTSLNRLELEYNSIPNDNVNNTANSIVNTLALNSVTNGNLYLYNQNATWTLAFDPTPLTNKSWSVSYNN